MGEADSRGGGRNRGQVQFWETGRGFNRAIGACREFPAPTPGCGIQRTQRARLGVEQKNRLGKSVERVLEEFRALADASRLR